MIDDIHIIDDVITKHQQDRLEQLMFDGRLPWMFFRDVAISDDEINRLGVKKLTPGIGAGIIQKFPNYCNHQLLNETKPVVLAACAKLNLTCKEILQGRSFMHFPLRKELRKEYDNIHVDMRIPHTVFLYYVNDTDGDTFLFDKTIDDASTPEEFKQAKFKIHKRVTPKKGRVVVFNGNRYHSSSGPTIAQRCIINFDVATINAGVA